MAAKLTIVVDEDIPASALQALIDAGHAVYDWQGIGQLDGREPDIVLGSRASFFDLGWWGEPKLVEAALKRARAEKRKEKKA